MPTRRRCLGSGLAAIASTLVGGAGAAGSAVDAEAAIRTGGVVVAMRHALAPGVYDPPGFRLDQCATQRNLNDEGRAQARRIGDWFRARSLQPSRVRCSPWCRCFDTATLAFGAAEVWSALGSPAVGEAVDRAAGLQDLQQALVRAAAQRGRFEVWVTHMFVLSQLVDSDAASGEALVLRADPASGRVQLLARLPST